MVWMKILNFKKIEDPPVEKNRKKSVSGNRWDGEIIQIFNYFLRGVGVKDENLSTI